MKKPAVGTRMYWLPVFLRGIIFLSYRIIILFSKK